jgi:hypothetical protein
MRGTVTEGLSSEWLDWRVEWRFLGLERDGAIEKSKPPLAPTRSGQERLPRISRGVTKSP